jgi:hypothetical protein
VGRACRTTKARTDTYTHSEFLILIEWLRERILKVRCTYIIVVFSDVSPCNGNYVPPCNGNYVPPCNGNYVPPCNGNYVPPCNGNCVSPCNGNYVPPCNGNYVPPYNGNYALTYAMLPLQEFQFLYGFPCFTCSAATYRFCP